MDDQGDDVRVERRSADRREDEPDHLAWLRRNHRTAARAVDFYVREERRIDRIVEWFDAFENRWRRRLGAVKAMGVIAGAIAATVGAIRVIWEFFTSIKG